jgi:hypothetical protein
MKMPGLVFSTITMLFLEALGQQNGVSSSYVGCPRKSFFPEMMVAKG